MKARILADPSGQVPAPPEKRFLIILSLLGLVGLGVAFAPFLRGCARHGRISEEQAKRFDRSLLPLNEDEALAVEMAVKIAHNLFGNKATNGILKLRAEKRLSICKVKESDMPDFYKLAREIGDIEEGLEYINACIITVECPGKPDKYIMAINEREFASESNALVVVIHELIGHLANSLIYGEPARSYASEVKAYTVGLGLLNALINHGEEIYKMAERSGKEDEDGLKWLQKALNKQKLEELRVECEGKLILYRKRLNGQSVSTLTNAATGGNSMMAAVPFALSAGEAVALVMLGIVVVAFLPISVYLTTRFGHY